MDVLVKPIITEKTHKSATGGTFTFLVERKATKPLIRTIVEKHFHVHVEDVHTSVRKGKTKRVGKKRLLTVLPDTKIAYVRLAKGEKIDLFDSAKTT